MHNQVDSPSESGKALAKPVSKICTWLVQNLAYQSNEGLHNTDQVNLWLFFIFPTARALCTAEGLRRHISNDISLAQEICGSDTFPCQLSLNKGIELSDQTVLLCCLMPFIPQWLTRANLLGRCAMTGDTYAAALLHTSYYLLRLPEGRLAEALDGKTPDNKLSASVLLSRKAFSTFMGLAPQTVKLYFFVLFMHSVITNYQSVPGNTHLYGMTRDGEDERSMAISAKRYLEAVSVSQNVTISGVPSLIGKFPTDAQEVSALMRSYIPRLHSSSGKRRSHFKLGTDEARFLWHHLIS